MARRGEILSFFIAGERKGKKEREKCLSNLFDIFSLAFPSASSNRRNDAVGCVLTNNYALDSELQTR